MQGSSNRRTFLRADALRKSGGPVAEACAGRPAGNGARGPIAAGGPGVRDGAGLLQPISRRTPAEQQELLQVAYEGEYWRPTCASCGTKMVERSRSSDGGLFWGCTNYPRCKRTLPKATGG